MVFTEDDEEMMILSDLIRYADHYRGFNRSFVDEIYDFVEKHEYLTEKQYEVLLSIYEKYNVQEFIDWYRG